jgi:transcriptional regulator with XRE-family HTH domain
MMFADGDFVPDLMIGLGSYDPKEVKMKLKPLASSQIRAARALLHWSAEDLARESALGLATIRRAENSENKTSMTAANDLSVRRALETAGVEFIEENGGGPGVRLRRRQRPKASKP